MKDPLIDPIIYVGPGGCIKCGTPLVVADKEIIVVNINNDGEVVELKEQATVAKALCPYCGNHQDMMRDPYNGIYRPYSKTAFMFSEMDMKERSKNRIRSINETDKNPLIKE